MKLAITHLRSINGLYGAEQVLLELCRQQVERYDDTRLLVFSAPGRPEPPLYAEARSRHLPAELLRCHGPIDPRCIVAIRRRLREAGYGTRVILHCHDYKSIIYGGLASAGLPVVRIATLHGWLNDSRRLRLYHWLEARMLHHFQRVCAVSPAIAERLLEIGLEPDAIRRVDNGIDTDRFQPTTTPDRSRQDDCHDIRHDNRLQLGTAARLSPEKNLGLLIGAIAECRSRGRLIDLTIVGEGPLHGELQSLVDQLDLTDQVSLPGNQRGLETWYPQLDAFVLPSLREGMPLSVLEALACGCPVIASAVGAIPDLLEGIPGCSTVPAGNREALVDALMSLEPRQQPVHAARDRVNDLYSGARMATRYTGIYREAILA
ncbi:MAG: glycosyltransferase [Wenzhouxiangella sp.]